MKKIVSASSVWSCENADLLAPICWEGFIVLFDNNSRQVVDSIDEVGAFTWTTEEERKAFANRMGYIFNGDVVEVVKGRKLPIGECKTVCGYFRYEVAGTYGHQYTEYLRFTDGTKTAMNNVALVGVKMFDKDPYLRYAKELPSFYIGGRI